MNITAVLAFGGVGNSDSESCHETSEVLYSQQLGISKMFQCKQIISPLREQYMLMGSTHPVDYFAGLSRLLTEHSCFTMHTEV